mmetsp:Transcript_17176/g.51443  ORF Transcript_17176/g.51443 Transcript_17176/m.51443 type:complete len:177 (+) Transcript_17176:39-569(+)
MSQRPLPQSNRPVPDDTWRERLAKEKARQPEVVPLPRGSLRSIPSPRFAAQFASPRSTYQEFCRNRPEPKIVNRKEISASFDPEAEARRQLELRKFMREGHLIFYNDDKLREQHHLSRMRAELELERKARLELQEQLDAANSNSRTNRAKQQAANLNNLSQAIALSPRGTSAASPR